MFRVLILVTLLTSCVSTRSTDTNIVVVTTTFGDIRFTEETICTKGTAKYIKGKAIVTNCQESTTTCYIETYLGFVKGWMPFQLVNQSCNGLVEQFSSKNETFFDIKELLKKPNQDQMTKE